MIDCRLFVTHSPNSANFLIERPFVTNVIAGTDYHVGAIPQGLTADNTGDNISVKNKSYCELTTLYWAWKNVVADYYGFCHYRRLLSFSPDSLSNATERSWGVYPFECLTEKNLDMLAWDESSLQKAIEGYDFLIAEKIDVADLGAESVFDNWAKAPELYVEDLTRFIKILKEKYPNLGEFADRYIGGTTFYPCNMFIMKKELLDEYCPILFDVLEEFEAQTDFSHYSVESARVTGHLAERLTGIYYAYISSQSSYKTRELEVAWYAKTAPRKMVAPSSPDAKGIVLAANDHYAPYLSVCIDSLCATLPSEEKVDIVIFSTDFSEKNKKVIRERCARYDNIRFDVIDVDPWLDDYDLEVGGIVDHISVETFYRFLILDIMKDYERVLYLDSDLIIREDVTPLFNIDMKDNLIAAVLDADYVANVNMEEAPCKHDGNDDGGKIESLPRKQYSEQVLGMKSPYTYFQAGVLLLDIPKLREKTSVERLMTMAASSDYIYMDQDILNSICDGSVHYLDMRWNVMMAHRLGLGRGGLIKKFAPVVVKDAYFASREHPAIIHYAGPEKPWFEPDCDFAREFWIVAKESPYYEVILKRMADGRPVPPVPVPESRRVRLIKRLPKWLYVPLKKLFHLIKRD